MEKLAVAAFVEGDGEEGHEGLEDVFEEVCYWLFPNV